MVNIVKRFGVIIIEYNEWFGYNVGCVIGVFEVIGDIFLFIDGDFSVLGSNLYYFIKVVLVGVDIVLNDLNLMLYFLFYVVDVVKYMFNLVYNCLELSNGLLVVILYVMSRLCLDVIGWESLLCFSFV